MRCCCINLARVSAPTGGVSGFGHAVPARVAVNMILCCVSGGSLAVAIACWAQVGKEGGQTGEEGGCVAVTAIT